MWKSKIPKTIAFDWNEWAEQSVSFSEKQNEMQKRHTKKKPKALNSIFKNCVCVFFFRLQRWCTVYQLSANLPYIEQHIQHIHETCYACGLCICSLYLHDVIKRAIQSSSSNWVTCALNTKHVSQPSFISEHTVCLCGGGSVCMWTLIRSLHDNVEGEIVSVGFFAWKIVCECGTEVEGILKWLAFSSLPDRFYLQPGWVGPLNTAQ